MTNVSLPHKLPLRSRLFEIALQTLERDGWSIERIASSGKSSVRRITKGKISKTVSIRTSQDTWIAFPRNDMDDGWATLADVDYVVAASVDNRETPRFGQIHLIDGNEMRARFDRAYEARKRAGYTMHPGRGIWISLYAEEVNSPTTLVGAGAGLVHPPIAKVSLAIPQEERAVIQTEEGSDLKIHDSEPLLTIREAKRKLALSLGVDENDITITINH